jgi:hypothetical protein
MTISTFWTTGSVFSKTVCYSLLLAIMSRHVWQAPHAPACVPVTVDWQEYNDVELATFRKDPFFNHSSSSCGNDISQYSVQVLLFGSGVQISHSPVPVGFAEVTNLSGLAQGKCRKQITSFIFHLKLYHYSIKPAVGVWNR